MINGLNHLTIHVTNLERSMDFYKNILGLVPMMKWDHGAYLGFPTGLNGSGSSTMICLVANDNERLDPSGMEIAFATTESGLYEISKRYGKSSVVDHCNPLSSEALRVTDPDGNNIALYCGDCNQQLHNLIINTKHLKGAQWLTTQTYSEENITQFTREIKTELELLDYNFTINKAEIVGYREPRQVAAELLEELIERRIKMVDYYMNSSNEASAIELSKAIIFALTTHKNFDTLLRWVPDTIDELIEQLISKWAADYKNPEVEATLVDYWQHLKYQD